MTKTLEDNFVDWEAEVFGYGYGTGEEHVLRALQRFLSLCEHRNGIQSALSYRHGDIEANLTPTVAWLLINTLCDAGIIEYGTSPRGGWLTKSGERLRDFVLSHHVETLCEIIDAKDADYISCFPDRCQCGPGGHVEGRVCLNPFWLDRLPDNHRSDLRERWAVGDKCTRHADVDDGTVTAVDEDLVEIKFGSGAVGRYDQFWFRTHPDAITKW